MKKLNRGQGNFVQEYRENIGGKYCGKLITKKILEGRNRNQTKNYV